MRKRKAHKHAHIQLLVNVKSECSTNIWLQIRQVCDPWHFLSWGEIYPVTLIHGFFTGLQAAPVTMCMSSMTTVWKRLVRFCFCCILDQHYNTMFNVRAAQLIEIKHKSGNGKGCNLSPNMLQPSSLVMRNTYKPLSKKVVSGLKLSGLRFENDARKTAINSSSVILKLCCKIK